MNGIWTQWAVVNKVRNDIISMFSSESDAMESARKLNDEVSPATYIARRVLVVAAAPDVSLN